MEIEQLIQSLKDKMQDMARIVMESSARCDALKNILVLRENELYDCVNELCGRCRKLESSDRCRTCRWDPIRRGGRS